MKQKRIYCSRKMAMFRPVTSTTQVLLWYYSGTALLLLLPYQSARKAAAKLNPNKSYPKVLSNKTRI